MAAGRRRVVAVVLVGVSSLGACADEAGGEDDGEFTILALVAKSGLAAPGGLTTLAGAEAAVDMINEAGGINGQKVTMKVVDTKSDPTHTVSVFTQEIAKDRPDMLWAGSSSAEVVGLLPVATREKIPFMTQTGAPQVGDGKAYPYLFSSIATQAPEYTALAEEMAREGYGKVGLIAPNDVLGTAVLDGLEAELGDRDITVSRELFEPDDLDMSAPLGRLESDGVDAVIFSAASAAAGYVVKSRQKIGMTEVPFYGTTNTAAGNLFTLITPDEGEGVMINTYTMNTDLPDDQRTEGMRDLRARLDEKNFEFVTSIAVNVIGWDAIVLGANGFAEVGKTGDVEAWRDAMLSLDSASSTFPAAASDEAPGWTPEP
jgi:branched-chain amino acid transport system substrate-binding protein